MRSPLLALLRCPVCLAEATLSLNEGRANAIEVESGTLECASCTSRFPLVQGTCNLCPAPSAIVEKELAAQQSVEDRTLTGSQDYASLVHDDARLGAFIRSLPEGFATTAEQAPVVRYALEALRPRAGDVALDVGAGMAWTTAMLADRGCRAIAVDISRLYLPRSRFLQSDSRYFDRVLGDMTALPVASGRFDIVFANAALHHSPDLGRTFAEIARALKPGGRAVFVNEPVAGRFERKRIEAFGKEDISDGFNEHIYRLHEWRSFATAAGLDLHFEISPAGIAEKIAARRTQSANLTLGRRVAYAALDQPALRATLLAAIGPLALRLYPFNVVMWARRP